MAKIHILDGSNGTFQAVIHAPAPTGSNDAGVSWATAIAGTGRNRTVMTVGNGAGQITNAESNAIVAGTTIEAVVPFQDNPDNDPAWDATKRGVYLLLIGNRALGELTEQYRRDLRLFGATAN
jgi:hypothetical protein